MINHNTANEIIKIGRNYLLGFKSISETILDKHLNEYKTRYKQLRSLSDIYKAILESARSMRHFPSVIPEIETLRDKLFGFDPNQVLHQYNNDYMEVFNSIAPKKIQSNPHNSWVKFSKTIISAANFLSQFTSFNDFINFIKAFFVEPIARIGLPLLLKEEIFGFGFALSCDFIKQNLNPYYVKPDTHIIDIFKGIKISRQEASNLEIFKDVLVFSEVAKEVPFVVDKLFWLIGSGNFYLNNLKIATNKQAFIEQVRHEIDIQ